MKKNLLFSLAMTALCWMAGVNAWALDQRDGVYQIGTAQDLHDFIVMVNEGTLDVASSVQLTADIDFSTDSVMLGNSEYRYAGTFDGQGHSITVGYNQSKENDAALFRYFTGTVENLVMKGSIQSSTKFAAGVGAHSFGATIRNVISLVDITATIAGDGTHAGLLAVADQTVTMENCVYAGSMKGGNTTCCGGLIGWADGGTSEVSNCLMVADISVNRSSSNMLSRNPSKVTFTNCVYCSDWGGDVPAAAIKVTADDVKSGAACWRLNGDQSSIHMYQTLGTDAYPTPFSTSKQVYAVGQLKCDGTAQDGATLTYNNESGSSVPSHDYVLGVCENCGQSDPNYLTQVDGFYQLTRPEHLVWLQNQVNTLGKSPNVQLTCDIDMSQVNQVFSPIGTTSNNYSGTFDGQGHRISNLIINLPESEAVGLFGTVNGATIKNLILDSSCQISGKAFVGLIGESLGGTVTMTNLGNEGSVSAVNQNAGGIIGCNMNTAATYIMTACYVTGTVTGNNESAAFSGWLGSGATVTSCWTIAEVEGIQEDRYFGRHSGDATFTNCYMLNGVQTGVGNIDAGDVASGKLTFALNGMQNNIYWYQKLGTDAQPTFDSTHPQVYYGAAMNCDGTPAGSGDAYTNTPSGQIPPHEYVDGFCKNCGAAQTDFCEQDEDGYYLLANAKQVYWFQVLVNSGNISAKAKLTADIDMSQAPDFEPIGTLDASYKGTFDGQYHRISNLEIDLPDQQGVGFFGVVGTCTIQNLILDSSCHITGNHFVGMIGQSNGGTLTLTNLGNEGTVTAEAQNAAGIYGCNSGSGATITITGCYTTGAISGGNESGAISGWLNSTGTIINCWSISEVTGTASDDTYLARPNSITVTNCYSAFGTQGKTGFVPGDAATGALTWLMNGNSFVNPTWYQTIGEDEVPTWDSTHGIVYKTSEGTYADIHDEAGYKKLRDDIVKADLAYCDSVLATQSLITDYQTALNELLAIDNLSEFGTQYEATQSQRTAIETSAAAYANYKAELAYTAAYLEEHDDFAGPDRDALVDYLEAELEPDETFPNGSSLYILNNHTLTTDEVNAEITFVKNLLATAINNGYSKGSEITNLLTNADFSNGTTGWTKNYGGITATGGSALEGQYAAECWNSSLDVSQTLNGLSNGVYALVMNGDFRWNQDYGTGKNYVAQVYANENNVYLPLQFEGMTTAEEAQDGVNCHLTGSNVDYEIEDEEGNVIGYVPMGPEGHTYYYSSGRYLNHLVANVTDGTLTVGVRSPKQLTTNGLWFGNFHLYYLGELSEAEENMDETLTDQKARATLMLEQYEFSVGDDYAVYPNYYQGLKEELQATLDAANAASGVEEKYALIQKFSRLFTDILDCKTAYISMIRECEALNSTAYDLNDQELIPESDVETALESCDQIWAIYEEGSMTAEQARTEAPTILRNNKVAAANVDGVYQIGNLANMMWFANVTNVADGSMNAALTADIDYSGQSTMIGTSSIKYSGTFDGQEHWITLGLDRSSDNAALFAYLEGATIKNLGVRGNIYTSAKYAAAFAAHTYGATLDHCTSAINISSSISGDGTHAGLIAVVETADNPTTVSYCSFGGTMTGSSTTSSGGLVGWASGTLNIDHCLEVGDISLGTDNAYTVCRNSGNVNASEVYYKKAYGSVNSGAILIDNTDGIATGAFCYQLAQEYGQGYWFQKLSGDTPDTYPVPFPSHGNVYPNGQLLCNGDPVDEDVAYTNTKTYTAPGHQFLYGVCKNCQTPLEAYMSPSGEYYLIDNPYQLNWFAAMVNAGHTDIKGALTCDLDMKALTDFHPIGTANQTTEKDARRCFKGVFDGNGHYISNLILKSDKKYVGLFGGVTGGAEIRNLVLDYTCSITGGSYVGMIGTSQGSGTVTMSKLGNEGNVLANGANAGGIIGCDMSSGCNFIMNDCYSSGRVEGLNESGALSGWVGGSSSVLTNCWSTAEVNGIQSYETYLVRPTSATLTNCYSLNGTQGTAVTADQVKGGELCYLLNGGETEPQNVTWFQTIGQDEHPNFHTSHCIVCLNEDGTYYNVESGMEDAIQTILASDSKVESVDVYDMGGRMVRRGVRPADSLKNLPAGIYIVNGRKNLVK